jgi:hypothetical protein
MKTQYNINGPLLPKQKSIIKSSSSVSKDINVNLADILLKECNNNNVCLKCKRCKRESSSSFSSNSIKKTFREIKHSCKKYRNRNPYRIGNAYTVKKKTRMRNRIKRMMRRTKKQPKRY